MSRGLVLTQADALRTENNNGGARRSEPKPNHTLQKEYPKMTDATTPNEGQGECSDESAGCGLKGVHKRCVLKCSIFNYPIKLPFCEMCELISITNRETKKKHRNSWVVSKGYKTTKRNTLSTFLLSVFRLSYRRRFPTNHFNQLVKRKKKR